MRLFFRITALVLSFITLNLQASDNTRAKVVYAGITGAGTVFVNVSSVINEPGCEKKSLWIPSESTVKAHVLSTALAAFASKQDVYVQTKGCYKGYPTLDKSDASWFHIYPAE
ncbi:hypothetical protein [Zooshikella harenae]|uniref:Uncharacterized protein n=1 Tax=Zooshikella harenae TaxID=2827238 RepID=A0ABS5ZBL8_9GAMM|nr:hypothetical protein [Zooshikella harenae]MBU2711370.1 hypothetical protein [Zooshikella harenae]